MGVEVGVAAYARGVSIGHATSKQLGVQRSCDSVVAVEGHRGHEKAVACVYECMFVCVCVLVSVCVCVCVCVYACGVCGLHSLS